MRNSDIPKIKYLARLMALVFCGLILSACTVTTSGTSELSLQTMSEARAIKKLSDLSALTHHEEGTSTTASLIALSAQKMPLFAPSQMDDRNFANDWFSEPLIEVSECEHCKIYGTSISSVYGLRKDPKRKNTIKHHHGIDIRAPKGTPALAFKGGTVIRAERYGDFGMTVEIRQYDGIIARYAHLSKIDVKKGQKLETGKKVGEVGRTGKATGNHLHFELIKDGKSTDPMLSLRQIEQVVRCQSSETASK